MFHVSHSICSMLYFHNFSYGVKVCFLLFFALASEIMKNIIEASLLNLPAVKNHNEISSPFHLSLNSLALFLLLRLREHYGYIRFKSSVFVFWCELEWFCLWSPTPWWCRGVETGPINFAILIIFSLIIFSRFFCFSGTSSLKVILCIY